MKTKNIATFLPVFTGFYGTIFEPDETNEIEYINEQREAAGMSAITYDECEFDYSDYHERVSKGAVNYVENELNHVFINQIEIVFEELISPKFYNFSNDSVNVQIKVTTAFLKELKEYLNTNKEAFALYIKDRYTSCSGFISSYSNQVETWLGEYWKELETKAHILGSILEFVCRNEEITDWGMMDRISGDAYLNCINYGELIPVEN